MRSFAIVSLWDMLRIDTTEILTPLTYLSGTVKFMQVIHGLVQSGVVSGNTSFENEERVQILACIKKLRDAANRLGLGASRHAADAAWENGVRRFASVSEFGNREQVDTIDELSYLVKATSDDMKSVCAFALPVQSAELFDDPDAHFGKDALHAFPSIEYDVREAGRCFALERHTAAVFHCMRILEVGLEAMSTNLGLSIASNWNNALNHIEKELRGRSTATHGPTWKDEEMFYSEAVTHFRVVKNAWRNHTMHGREVFDEERARGIFQSTADFTRHLATRLSE